MQSCKSETLNFYTVKLVTWSGTVMPALEEKLNEIGFAVSDVEIEMNGVYQWPVKRVNLEGIPVLQVKA